jgi:murein DD-endopeptidase MepM/ murein hydrolase activator NlpD
VAQVRESHLFAQRRWQRLAQGAIKRFQRAGLSGQRREGAAIDKGLRSIAVAAGGGGFRALHGADNRIWKDMQIILVSRARKLPKTLDLANRSQRWKLLSMLSVAVLGCLALGGALALAIASPRDHALAQIQELQAQIQQQNAQLGSVRADAHRSLDALAVKLGQLQAQSTRLNALGERLVQVGKLDDGEFNFDQAPAVGGVEDTAGADYALPTALESSIDQLTGQFNIQQAQLSALQSLLLDARIESNLKPTGMPVPGYISSYFGVRPDPFDGHSARHTGIDIATPYGTPVHAVAEGMVTFAGVRRGYGNVVEIDHGNGYMTRYAHNSKLDVHPGQHVQVGDVIAQAGSTGRSTGSHVHFEVWYKGRVVNPLAFVRNHR